MRTSDFYIKPNANSLNETMSKKFGEKLDITNYSTEQLLRAVSLIETKIDAYKKGKFNETLDSEEFHRLKMMHDVVKTALSERAVSKSQQQAAGAALAAKRKGTTKGLKGASKEMSKMSTKELEKFAGTKHKGLPKKVDEGRMSSEELAQYHAEEYAKCYKEGKLEAAIHHRDACESLGGKLSHGMKGECYMSHAAYGSKPKIIVVPQGSMIGAAGAGVGAAMEEGKKAKPDFLDMDKDGNKKEPMKKAVKDAKGDKDKPAKKGMSAKQAKFFGGKKKTMKESIEFFLAEGEEGKAELIMAVKDMVDKFTGWSEDIAQMQAQTAMEMADAIRDEMGSDQAEQFTAAVTPALDSAFQAVKAAREALNGTVGTLTGEGGAPMGAETPGLDTEEPAADTSELPAAPDTGMEEPAGGDEGGDIVPTADREKRESVEFRNKLTKILVGR